MLEKKMKTLLLLISISLSAAIFYITMSSNESIVNIAKEKLNTAYGYTEFIVSANTNNNSPFIEKQLKDDIIDKQLPILNMYGSYQYDGESQDVDINGIDYNNFDLLTNTTIIEEKDITPFEGNKIIITKIISDKYNLKLGSEIDIKVNKRIQKFKICAVTKNEGLMYSESNGIKVVAPYSYTEKELGIKDKATMIYGKYDLSKVTSKEAGSEKLTENYKKYKITDLSPEEFLDGLNSNISQPLAIILLIVLIMSSFIIYTSVNLIIIERMPVVGTFLSVGATRGKVNRIFFLESFISGLFAGLIGNILGFIGSYFLLYINSDAKEFGVSVNVDINAKYILYTFLLAIALSVIASVIPVLRTNKISIKNIILNIKEEKVKRKNWTLAIGIVLILFIILDKYLISAKYDSVVSIINILIVFILSIIMLDTLINILVKPLAKMTKELSAVNFLSLNNVTSSKSLLNNIRLTSICIIVIVIISTVSFSIIKGLDNLYSQFSGDIEIMEIQDLKKTTEYLNKEKDIKSYIELYNLRGVKVLNGKGKIGQIQGMDPEAYKQYNNYFVYENKEKNLNSLKENERNILMSNSLLDKFNKKVGDYIDIVREDKEVFRYKITGYFNAQMENMGSVALISKENIKKDFEMINPSRIAVELKSGVDVNQYFKALNGGDIKNSVKYIEMEETRKARDVNTNKSFLGILQGASFFCLIIGGFGILNNMIINFIQRKKELAVLSSVGMDDSSKYMMLFLEALHCGLISIAVSVFSSVIIVLNLEGVFKIMGTYMKVIFTASDLLKYSLLALLVILISSISTLVRAKNISVIEEIRFE
jgi:putative ABC transport system permease protein